MKLYTRLILFSLGFAVIACEAPDELTAKKAELQELKEKAAQLKSEIDVLEKEIATIDPDFAKSNRKSVLVTSIKPENGGFEHYIEVTGSVLSKKNVNISGEVSGSIQEVRGTEGMRVSKGQILAVIDAETIQRNIDELEKQMELAKIVFEKQERLWKQEIGTEIQYLEAKNRMETLEKSLAGLNTQRDRATVRAPFSGSIEAVLVRLGELVQPGTPMFQIVGDSDLFIEADLSERYVSVVKHGDEVKLTFPSLGKELTSKITSVGGVINPNNRTFKVEIMLPASKDIKPNMVSVLKIQDYENPKAIYIPIYLIQRDSKGEYVYVIDGGVSKKKYVTSGMTYNQKTEVKEGLDGNEILVDKGFNEVGDGNPVTITK